MAWKAALCEPTFTAMSRYMPCSTASGFGGPSRSSMIRAALMPTLPMRTLVLLRPSRDLRQCRSQRSSSGAVRVRYSASGDPVTAPPGCDVIRLSSAPSSSV